MTEELTALRGRAEAAKTNPESIEWQQFWDRLTEDQIIELLDAVSIARGERDAALAAIERVKEMHRPESNERYTWCVGCSTDEYAEDWPCPTVAALDGAPEPEWEYGSGPEDAIDQSGLHTSRTAAERGVAEWNEFTQRSERMGGRPLERLVLVRRRKAGPWLPME